MHRLRGSHLGLVRSRRLPYVQDNGDQRRRPRRRAGVGPAHGARGVLLQPQVDAGGVEHVRAAQECPHRLSLLQRAQAHRALRRRNQDVLGATIGAFPVGEGRERGDGGGVEPGLLPPGASAGGGRAPPLEQSDGEVDDKVDDDEDAEADADQLERGIQIAGVALVLCSRRRWAR